MQLDDGAWMSAVDVYVAERGSHTVRARAYDLAGNAAEQVTSVTILGPPPLTLKYAAAEGGWIDGSAIQAVDSGSDATTVIATPNSGYHFVRWSDGVLSATRRDSNVVADASVVASFAPDTFTFATTTRITGASGVRVKRTLKLAGTVSPAGPGAVTITMQRKVGRKWKGAGHVHAGVVGGKYRRTFKPKYRGSWRFFATYSGGVAGVRTYAGSKSGYRHVKVK
jgi:hypothetical protein